MKSTFTLVSTTALLLLSCTEPRVRTYAGLLDPLVGSADKAKVSSLLGTATRCETKQGAEKCEYRTRAGRNEQTPSVYQPQPGFGPDVSSYEHFDVIEVQYNDIGKMRDWTPVVLNAGPK